MLYSSLAIFALSACGALAAPWGQYEYTTDLEISVELSNSPKGLGSRTDFMQGQRQEQPPQGGRGPFTTVNIHVGKNVRNKDIRCKLLDGQGKEIQAERGPNNVDTTFADGGKGEWTFLKESEVSSVICDPAFKKGAGSGQGNTDNDKQITVLLQDQATETGVSFSLTAGGRDEENVRAMNEFSTVTLTSPASQKDSLRCQILDKAGKAITVKRGENVDTTFADGGKGAWTFKTPARAQIGKIICDPTFKKATA